MKKPTFIFLFVFLLLALILLSIYLKRIKSKSEEPSPGSVAEKQIFTDPYVLHLRKALDGYLAGTNEGMSEPDLVIKPVKGDDKHVTGLDSFPKEYYQSKFVVISKADSLAGGKAINILFVDRPDKIFYTWVYLQGDGTYDLRGFRENTDFTKEDIEKIKKSLPTFLPTIYLTPTPYPDAGKQCSDGNQCLSSWCVDWECTESAVQIGTRPRQESTKIIINNKVFSVYNYDYDIYTIYIGKDDGSPEYKLLKQKLCPSSVLKYLPKIKCLEK